MELLEYSGGLKGTAYTRTVTIKRYAENENQVIDINLDSLRLQGKDYELIDGDMITIAKIPEVVENGQYYRSCALSRHLSAF